MSDSKKLRKLKDIRRKDLERNFLDVQLKGCDHYVFIDERGKAQLVYKGATEGRWVAEHIRTAILKFNFQVEKTKSKKSVKEFTEQEILAYEKKFNT